MTAVQTKIPELIKPINPQAYEAVNHAKRSKKIRSGCNTPEIQLTKPALSDRFFRSIQSVIRKIMKKHLYSNYGILLTIMRVTFYQLVCIVFLSAMAYAHHTPAQELLNRGVSIKLSAVTLRQALNEIETDTKVRFAYSRELVRNVEPITISAKNEPLSSLLDRLLAPLGISYRVVDNQILLSKTKREVLLTPVPENKQTAVQPVTDLEIAGIVTGTDGSEPLPGVSVVIKGSTAGTTTDIEGKYKLTVPENGAILIFSFVGYVSQEMAVGTRTRIDVKLQADIKALNEVVVVGYGTQKRGDITGAVASISAKDINGHIGYS